ncbi:hypothetical protein M5D96_004897 [Drosophila gunungcola]|uniref:Attractin/MKLN-like beta-propeller domain-containing protein n=1 Tax=Drosophila gunungcola TaxID=103775 RepID=A0A9Q0BTQ1_9MUSC|nr:hypothetical protein M5D96_004897 [Drosophila gunungcola]
MPVLYGHTAVYHPETNSVYLFGGYSTEPQSSLYALDLQKLSWTELPSFRELNSPASLLPRARYFHSAVSTEHYMILYGGRTQPFNGTDVLIAYVYACNQWVRLTEDVELIGRVPASSYAEDMAIDPDTGVIFVIGGWDGSSTHSHVTRIALPDDICQLWSSGKASVPALHGLQLLHDPEHLQLQQPLLQPWPHSVRQSQWHEGGQQWGCLR